MHFFRFFHYSVIISLAAFVLSACSSPDAPEPAPDKKQAFPQAQDDARHYRNGKLSGEGGLHLFDSDDEAKPGVSSAGGVSVNSFLWRATLDTLSFAPLAQADPVGGVITTDWYENPNAKGERFKVNALILDASLRSDGLRVSVFKQVLDAKGNWRDSKIDPSIAHNLEDDILTRAREMRVAQKK